MDAKLVLVREGLKPTVVRLKKLPMTVGRGREADLTIAHPMVSRLHCELYEVDDTLCVRDMGSLNGTFVGESQVEEAALESGDQLIVGSAKFQVVIDEDVEAGKEIEAPAVTADDGTEDPEGSVVAATEFDDLQEGEFEEVEEFDETDEGVEEFDEGVEGFEGFDEVDEGVEEPAAASEFNFEDQEDDEVDVTDEIDVTDDVDDVIVTDDTEDVDEEDVDEVDVDEVDVDEVDVDEVIVTDSTEADEEADEEATEEAAEAASEDAEAPDEEDQPEAEEEETESFFPPQDDEIGEPAEEPAASSGKIDLGISGDDAPAKVDTEDDDLTDFLAGLN